MTDPKTLTAERDAFEEWAAGENMKIARDRENADRYAFAHAKHAWQGWLERATREQTASTGTPTDEQIDAVFHKWAGANDWGTAYLRCYVEGFRPIARAILAAPVEQAGSTPDETLREALADAIEELESWASYAAPYFQEKHDLAGTLTRLRRALATPTKPEMQPEGLVSSCQALSETAGESAKKSADVGCICQGNWRAIVKESEHLLDRAFTSYGGKVFTFYGAMCGSDDYYYVMAAQGELRMLSCVGDIESYGYALLPQAPAERNLEGPSLLPGDPGQDEQDA